MTRIDLIFKMRLQESDVSCSIFRDRGPIKKWGCSSAGRAPALQAGGQGFDSLHLHHQLERVEQR